MTLCLGLPGWVSTRRTNHSGFCWSRDDGVAEASAEPYVSYLHFAPEDNHTSTSSLRFLQARCPSWHPTNSVKALKAKKHWRQDHMNINSKKSEEMALGSLKPLTITSTTVEPALVYKLLGISIDNAVRWDSHAAATVSKAWKWIWFLKKLNVMAFQLTT